MPFRGLVDGKGERFCHRKTVVIIARRVACVVKQRRSSVETLMIVGEGHSCSVAIGRGLLVREGKATKRLR